MNPSNFFLHIPDEMVVDDVDESLPDDERKYGHLIQQYIQRAEFGKDHKNFDGLARKNLFQLVWQLFLIDVHKNNFIQTLRAVETVKSVDVELILDVDALFWRKEYICEYKIVFVHGDGKEKGGKVITKTISHEGVQFRLCQLNFKLIDRIHSTQIVLAPIGHRCDACHNISMTRLLVCQGCRGAYFCHQLCQTIHWQKHRKECREKRKSKKKE